MKKFSLSLVVTSFALAACGSAPEESPGEPIGSAAQAITGVSPPDFSIPNTAYYCDVVWPSAGGSYWTTSWGDINTSPCGAGAVGSKVKRAGLFTNNEWNIAEEWCDPNYYWNYETWGGSAAINAVTGFAANTHTNGNCWFKVTVAPQLRGVEDTIVPLNYWSDPANSFAIPGPSVLTHPGLSFNAAYFQTALQTAMTWDSPVGYQISVRAPLTAAYPAPLGSNLVLDVAYGSVTGAHLPKLGNVPMTSTRRFDLASVSKTITAVATMAAFDDMAANGNPQQVTLESSINPYLQMIWPGGVDASLQTISFRDLLRHTTPLCLGGRNSGGYSQDSYLGLKTLMSQGATPPGSDGSWEPGPTQSQPGNVNYCDKNYALLRILVPLVLEGAYAFRNPDNSRMSDTQIDQLTSVLFRNYVKSRLFAPIGLIGPDAYDAGDVPETIYFTGSAYPPAGTAIPDMVNVSPQDVNWQYSGQYDQRADTTISTVGSGFWYMSADEVSFFLANLWAGNIVPTTTVSKMLTPGEYNLGMDWQGSVGGQPTFGKNGGGWAGGSQTQWVTFSDGYVAVILSNTPNVDFRALLENNYMAAWQPMYHGWSSPVAGCSTAYANATAPTADGGTYPYIQGDSPACKAWKLAATVCNSQPVAYGWSPPGDWYCPSSGGFTDPNFGTFCAVSNQYACSDCAGACNAACEFTPLSLRNCSGTETSQQ